jgi:protein phosphatase
MLVCPNCKTENVAWARHCGGCGQPLPEAGRKRVKLDLEDESPVASTQPLQRPATPQSPTLLASGGTRPLQNKPGFGPRPDGAIFGDRFLLARLDFTDDAWQRYLVNEINVPPEARMRACPNCGAVLARPQKHCTACGAELTTQAPTLWLVEASTRAFFGPSFGLASHGLAHPAVRAPVAAFEERLGPSLRHCLITPAVEPLPSHLERGLILESAAGLIDGLRFLHSVGLTFGGKLSPATFGLANGRLVWADFSSNPVHADLVDKAAAADTRALAEQLYAWLTGRAKFSSEAALASPLKALFNHALTGKGFANAGALAAAWAESYQPEQPRPQVDVRSGRRTDVGRVRTLNEDSLMAVEVTRIMQSQPEPLGVYVVADGMGGHSAGEVASSTIVNNISRRAVADLASTVLPSVDPVDYGAWLRDLVEAANRSLFDLRQQAGTDMGTTLVAAVVDGTQAYIAHVGDSRAYLISASGIQRLTVDHSLVERLVTTGQITAEQARTHEQRNVIYRTMGDKANVEVETGVQQLQPGDRLLLCSDGLSGMVTDEQILAIVRGTPSLQAACDELIKAANAGGGTDNITAILVEVVPTAPPVESATLSTMIR